MEGPVRSQRTSGQKQCSRCNVLELSLVRRTQKIEAKQRARDLGLEVLRPQEAKVQPPLPDLNFWAAFLGVI